MTLLNLCLTKDFDILEVMCYFLIILNKYFRVIWVLLGGACTFLTLNTFAIFLLLLFLCLLCLFEQFGTHLLSNNATYTHILLTKLHWRSQICPPPDYFKS